MIDVLFARMPKMYSTPSFRGISPATGPRSFVSPMDVGDGEYARHDRRRTTARENSFVVALPPRSPVSTLSSPGSDRPLRSRFARSARFTCSSIMAAAKSSASGLAMPLPAISGRTARPRNRCVRARCSRRDAQTADQSGEFIGRVCRQTGWCHDHVRIARVEHELVSRAIHQRSSVATRPSYFFPTSRAVSRNIPVNALSTFAL